MSTDWFWEGNVQQKIVDHLLAQKHTVIKFANTLTKEAGPDIIADRGGRGLLVSVKGYPSKNYADPRRASEVKKTHPATQARHWFREALAEMIFALAEDSEREAAMGLPDHTSYVTAWGKVRPITAKLGIKCFFVSENGQVREV